MAFIRLDGRAPDELRPVNITPGYLAFAEGSALIVVGQTQVLCAVSVEERVPFFLRERKSGWVTAEYGMLPRSTLTRTPREAAQGRVEGRSHEIQRLIGRSLRAIVDLPALGERTLVVDCDVLQADGGTRTAAITGAFVALADAADHLRRRGLVSRPILREQVAATSVGLVEAEPRLDLAYAEDALAEVDMNVVMTGGGAFVEVQGTAEDRPFTRAQLDVLLDLAARGIARLLECQREALGETLVLSRPRP